jgi:hypothetical protein
MKKAGWILAIVLLLATGFLGLYNGIRDRGQGLTALQHSVTIAVLLYGVLGFTGAFGLLRRRRWSVGVALAWAAVVTYTGTVASFAFHDPTFAEPGTLTAVLGSFLGSGVASALVVWGAHVATKPVPTASTT